MTDRLHHAPEGAEGATTTRARAIDLFAGAGGASLGLIAAGWDVVAAVEWNKDAAATYRRNIGDHVIEADITTLSPDALPDADYIHFSAPCQGHSFAGKRDLNDSRNDLWHDAFRMIAAKRPAFITSENVMGQSSTGYDLRIMRAFEAIGYRMSRYKLNSADYGVPQTRKRVILIGNRLGLPNPCPTPTHAKPPRHLMFGLQPWVTVRQALGIVLPIPDDAIDKPSQTLRGPGAHVPLTSAGRLLGGFVSTECTDHGLIDPDAPSFTIKAGGNRESGGHMGGACPPSIPYVELDTPAPNISAGGTETGGAEPVRHRIAGLRRLSVVECATLQNFPPNYVFTGSQTSQYRQVGNAFPRGLARAVAAAIKEQTP